MADDPGSEQLKVEHPAGPIMLTIAPPSGPPTKGLRPWLDTLAKLLPTVIVLFFALWYHTELSNIIRSTGRFEGFGFKWEKEGFDKALGAAVGEAKKKSGAEAVLSTPQIEPLFKRLNLASSQLRNMRVLWVDDMPENNLALRRILVDLGMKIDIALYNAEAIDKARRNDYDLFISDFGRWSNGAQLEETGADFANWVYQQRYDAPFLFYTSSPAKVPKCVPRVFVTNNPGVLLTQIAEIGIDGLAGNRVVNSRPEGC